MIRAVVGILQRGEKILIAERPVGKSYSGYWEFPGGKIESQETGFDALVRELHEELGIEVTNAKHCFDHHYSYPDKRVYLELWLITQFAGEPHSKENQTLEWVTWPELLTKRLLEGNVVILNKIKSSLGEAQRNPGTVE